MTTIEEMAKEQNLNEFSHVWTDYRKMTAEGIVHYSDDKVRELFAQMSMLQAHTEMRLGIADANYKRQKWIVDLEVSRLLAEIYKVGAMNNRKAQVESDTRYKVEVDKLMDLERDKIIAQAQATAAETAANSLSRDLSVRIKS